MKPVSRKALRLASEYNNRQYKVSRRYANELGIIHNPRWRQYMGIGCRYYKFMYGHMGPIALNVGVYKKH